MGNHPLDYFSKPENNCWNQWKYKLDANKKRLTFMALLCKSNSHVFFAEANDNSSSCPSAFVDWNCLASKKGRFKNVYNVVLYLTLKLLSSPKIIKPIQKQLLIIFSIKKSSLYQHLCLQIEIWSLNCWNAHMLQNQPKLHMIKRKRQ